MPDPDEPTALWKSLTNRERHRRATTIQLQALKQELHSRGHISGDFDPNDLRPLFETIPDDTYRTLRKQALEHDNENDYVDNVAVELANHLEQHQ